ncbi:DUF5017 domain-containing protein [Mucilaginibacter mali]|uniref:DUF5017 domain-containing protein n=1 Tax=Mucilaginibacter mali TaxID=2740462 RepID=A0A7D4UM62_9SPHI|nr:DUF5017 domain-containing protein [Mucilaginibacter mali]QKJ32622.1 DUF5017 domain-containing protein [Mucilaginibacter mali]
MKHIYQCLVAGLVVVGALSSCKKQAIDTPNFDVTVDKTSYAVNEPIVYTFSGTADIVTLYSGINTSTVNTEYKNKDRLTIDGGKPQMQFTSFRSGTSTQANTLKVLMSADYDNILNPDDIQKATWNDLTAKFTLSTGVDNTASGLVDLTDQMKPNTPVYLAFKYVAKKDAAVAQPTWTIKNLAITNTAPDGTVTTIATIANSLSTTNWGVMSIANSANNWTYNTTALTFTGGAINADDNEDWIISQPIQLDRAIRASGTNIKASPTTRLTTYTFPGYATAGTYTVTFEAINANKWDTRLTTKEFTITVK